MSIDVEQVGTVISDVGQRILHVDDRYTQIIGRESASLVGRKALSFTYVEDLPSNQPALDRLSTDGSGFTITKRYVRGDGGLVWVRNHVTKISDGIGPAVLCATTQQIERPFGSERLTRNYTVAQRLCSALVFGRRQMTPEVFSAPAIEALLWLYRAEIEGKSLRVEELAALTSTPSSVMIRWVALLEKRELVSCEHPGSMSGGTFVRISVDGERKLDSLLSGLAE